MMLIRSASCDSILRKYSRMRRKKFIHFLNRSNNAAGSLDDGLEESCCPVGAAWLTRFLTGLFNPLFLFITEKIVMGAASNGLVSDGEPVGGDQLNEDQILPRGKQILSAGDQEGGPLSSCQVLTVCPGHDSQSGDGPEELGRRLLGLDGILQELPLSRVVVKDFSLRYLLQFTLKLNKISSGRIIKICKIINLRDKKKQQQGTRILFESK